MTWTAFLQQVQPPCRSLPLRSRGSPQAKRWSPVDSRGFLQCRPGSYDQWNPSIVSLLVQK